MRFFFCLPSTSWSRCGLNLLTANFIMLRNNRNSRLQDILFIWKQSPIRKLESCESRFLWKNGIYSRTTWKTFAYHHRLGTPVLPSLSIFLFFLIVRLGDDRDLGLRHVRDLPWRSPQVGRRSRAEHLSEGEGWHRNVDVWFYVFGLFRHWNERFLVLAPDRVKFWAAKLRFQRMPFSIQSTKIEQFSLLALQKRVKRPIKICFKTWPDAPPAMRRRRTGREIAVSSETASRVCYVTSFLMTRLSSDCRRRQWRGTRTGQRGRDMLQRTAGFSTFPFLFVVCADGFFSQSKFFF